jgi:hypothetical protein
MASVRPSPRHWSADVPGYLRAGALCLALMGVGLSLALPIHGAFTLGDVASPHTPLHARRSAELRGRVVARVATAGLYLTLLGLGTYAAQSLYQRLYSPKHHH